MTKQHTSEPHPGSCGTFKEDDNRSARYSTTDKTLNQATWDGCNSFGGDQVNGICYRSGIADSDTRKNIEELKKELEECKDAMATLAFVTARNGVGKVIAGCKSTPPIQGVLNNALFTYEETDCPGGTMVIAELKEGMLEVVAQTTEEFTKSARPSPSTTTLAFSKGDSFTSSPQGDDFCQEFACWEVKSGSSERRNAIKQVPKLGTVTDA
ncbi:hypothetical protein B0J13DRAFT_649454 [Dactylonectria estremocensis]|uniref:Uncharacterized protein n=1 Tax=Dactylonectria estremocensis TaxID=1079267 RepID=A0A9P9DJ22_9HYPO|nr:hypothetical protein B0J13DRAFT_649454 [Dactylonectria estremocensis]